MIRSLPTISVCVAVVYLALPHPQAMAPPPYVAPAEVRKEDMKYSIYEIVVDSEERAKEILERITKYENVDFENTARVVSSSSTAQSGGYVGTYTAAEMTEKFGENLSNSFQNEDDDSIFNPIKSDEGWIIYQVHQEASTELPVFTPVPVNQNPMCHWIPWMQTICNKFLY